MSKIADYVITKEGEIISNRQKKPRALKPQENGNGYLKVFLRTGGKTYQKYVHRLVAEAYLPNPNELPTVNHKNGIKNDNRACNLEWASYSEQTIHMYRVLGRKHPSTGKKGSKGFAAKEVYKLSLDGEVLQVFGSLVDAAESIGVGVPTLSSACSGRQKTSGGFVWRLKEALEKGE